MRRVTPLLTRDEAAERLNVSESTVYRLRRSGVIKDVRMGRRCVRIDPASVEDYIRGPAPSHAGGGLMLTAKRLSRSRRKIAAGGIDALAHRRSLRAKLDRVARFSPDEGEAAASAHALAVLTGHQWQDSAFDLLGVPVPRRPFKPVGPLGGAR